MAFFNIEFMSQALARSVSFKGFVPNDVPPFVTQGNKNYERPMKTLILLHGYSDATSSWIFNSNIMELSGKYNMAIFCPSGENSFYLDREETGAKYGTYVGEELLSYVRKTFGLSDKREDTLIAGLSMGGFGAFHVGLSHSETFGGIVALSSALIVHEVANMKEGEGNPVANYAYYKTVFGEPSTVEASRNNPEVLVDDILSNHKPMPKIYMAIGTEDFLYENNQVMKKFLESRNVEFVYREEPGVHDFVFWNKHIEPGIQYVLGLA